MRAFLFHLGVVCVITWSCSSGLRVNSQELPGLLEAHNLHRAQHGASALSWDESLAVSASEWADYLAETCTIFHSTDSENGENIYICSGGEGCASGSNSAAAVDDTVAGWYESEKALPLTSPSHLTQLIWISTSSVGCAVSSCQVSNSPSEIVVCKYNPPGNVDGQYEANALPAGGSQEAAPADASAPPTDSMVPASGAVVPGVLPVEDAQQLNPAESLPPVMAGHRRRRTARRLKM